MFVFRNLCRVFEVIDKNRAEREVSFTAKAADSEAAECDSVSSRPTHQSGSAPMGIETKELSFWYPSQPDRCVLDKVSVKIGPRQLVAFVGKSGSGKSTLLAIIAGLYACRKGEVSVGGCDLSHSHDLVKQQVSKF